VVGIPPGVIPPVRPVKGQILRLHGPVERPLITRSVVASVHGSSVYLVPRLDGEVVVGSTVEEQGFDTTVTADAVYELLRDARLVVPGSSDLVLDETMAGLRPGSPDNGPVVGPSALDGLVIATGHYRNGILLAPITAASVVATLTGAEPPVAMAPFAPGRFRPHEVSC
jgi:glycine oxidase